MRQQTLSIPDPPAADKPEALWADWSPGNDRARQKLVEYYTPLVVNVIDGMLRRLPPRLTVRELLGAGVLGLYQAIEHFDGQDPDRFPAYASQRIRGSVLDELRRQDPLTRDQRRHYHRICAFIATYSQDHHQQPTMEQIATGVDLSVEKVDMYLKMGQPLRSLEEEVPGGLALHEILPSPEPDPAQCADHVFAREALRKAFRTLSKREQQVLFLRLYENLRVSEIAQAMQLTEGRVSQIYWECVAKLRLMLLAQNY